MELLHALAARHVLAPFGKDVGEMTASQLNDAVAAWPEPAEAVKLMGLALGDCPILYVDIGIPHLIERLGAVMFEGRGGWPVFYMPVKAMDGWADNPQAQDMLAYLHKNGLDVQLTLGGSATWLRGHWVMLCDMRLRFQRDVSLLEAESVKLLGVTPAHAP